MTVVVVEKVAGVVTLAASSIVTGVFTVADVLAATRATTTAIFSAVMVVETAQEWTQVSSS